MMSIRTIAAAIVVTIAPLTAVDAADEDGNSWFSKCRFTMDQIRGTSKEALELMNCAGYARGVADTIQIWQVAENDKAPACIPVKVTAQQLIDIGLKFMRENPAQRHLTASLLLMRAYSVAWPCKK
jgi:hypothetical protein